MRTRARVHRDAAAACRRRVAAEGQAYSAAMTYATPFVPLGQGDTLKFTNLDTLAQHDLAADDGKFASDLVGAGQSSMVKGVETLPPGAYPFHCTLHTWMRGVVNVAPVGTGGDADAPGHRAAGGGAGAGDQRRPTRSTCCRRPRSSRSARATGRSTARTSSTRATAARPARRPRRSPSLGPVWSYFSPKGDFTGTPVVARQHARRRHEPGLGPRAQRDDRQGQVDAQRRRADQRHRGDRRRPRHRPRRADALPARRRARPRDRPRSLWDQVIDQQKNSDVYGSPTVWDGTVYIGVSALFGETGDPEVNVRGSVNALDLAHRPA